MNFSHVEFQHAYSTNSLRVMRLLRQVAKWQTTFQVPALQMQTKIHGPNRQLLLPQNLRELRMGSAIRRSQAVTEAEVAGEIGVEGTAKTMAGAEVAVMAEAGVREARLAELSGGISPTSYSFEYKTN
jgi:hypothetical protein